MKKTICTLFLFSLLVTALFADKNRFYENGKLLDIMYVDSEDGLKVRDYPSLKSNRLCGLNHRLPVKIVAVGKEETIDGITSPWIQILVPCYEWKSSEPEYGWVFGGYLSKNRPDFVKPRTPEELKRFFEESGNLFQASFEDSRHRVSFVIDGNQVGIGIVDQYGKDSCQGDITFLSRNKFKFSSKSNEYIKGTFELSNIREDGFDALISDEMEINGGKSKLLTFTIYKRKQDLVFNSSAIYFRDYYNNVKKIYSNSNSSSCSCYFKDGIRELNENKFVKELIKSGVSAMNTIYENQYLNYWNPIMEEHQKQVDAMK